MSQSEAPKEGRRARKRREIRERIQQAAQELFLDMGYDHVTVEQVADRADVSRATFFNYYPSKAALLRELAETLTERLHRFLQETSREETSTQEQLRAFFLYTADAVQRTRRLSQDLFLESMRAPESEERSTDQLRLPYKAIVVGGQRRGDVDPSHDAGFLAEMIGGTLAAILMNWMSEPDYPLRERAELAARFLGNAMKPGTARALSEPPPPNRGSSPTGS
jgi:AcrR family transcriptional regulator